ncbi:MAG: hypothetical protein A2583_10945 [Bdellovibrionales bacterium RIFOXYD1_FULL_53_11]|nr:MAG: hypothetical protein A2583_10945 [Bdellovibrionales bacterium RIFOXYD1_FULL_53_11]
MKKFILFAGVSLFPAAVMASIVNTALPVNFSVDASGGYSQRGVSSALKDTPRLGQYGFGISGGYETGPFIFGFCSDFRFINQYSTVKVLVGNTRGTRWNIVSPMAGFRYGAMAAKMDFQFLGNYNLSNKTADNADLSYGRPLGGRVAVYYVTPFSLLIGAYYEHVWFGSEKNSTKNEQVLSQRIGLWQSGLTASLDVF